MAGYCTLVLYFHLPAARENTAAHSCNIQPYYLLTYQIIYIYVCVYCRSGNFCCKNIFVACVNHESKKNTKYILQWMIITVSAFLYTLFHVKLASFVGILNHKNILKRKIKHKLILQHKNSQTSSGHPVCAIKLH